jgi:hypothetical protein
MTRAFYKQRQSCATSAELRHIEAFTQLTSLRLTGNFELPVDEATMAQYRYSRDDKSARDLFPHIRMCLLAQVE